MAVLTAVAAVTWQLVWEYYWHRLMHLPPFYRRFHKVFVYILCACACAYVLILIDTPFPSPSPPRTLPPIFVHRRRQMHHYYKSPQPFDDMYIHPLEALGYYLILYSPAFVFR